MKPKKEAVQPLPIELLEYDKFEEKHFKHKI